MLKITDIKNINFRKANLGGYRPEDVDEFIDEVTASYDQLLKDNAELTKQVEILAQKIETYRADEDNIRAALMNAQKLGEASIRESKHKSDIILKDAAVKSERLVTNAQREVAKQEEMVDSLKTQIASFKNRLMVIYKEHMNLIEALPEDDDEPKRDRPVERTARISDVMDVPSLDFYEGIDEDDEEDERAQEAEVLSAFSKKIPPQSPVFDSFEPEEDDREAEKIAPSGKSNIEEVVNPFNTYLTGQNFPVSPISFGDEEPKDKPKKPAPPAPPKQGRPPQRPERGEPDNRREKKPRRPEPAEKADRPAKMPPKDSKAEDRRPEPPQKRPEPPQKRRDRGGRREMAVDIADRADREEGEREKPAAEKKAVKPPRGAQVPPKQAREEDESRFGKLKFGPDYVDDGGDDKDDLPMGMFRRRR